MFLYYPLIYSKLVLYFFLFLCFSFLWVTCQYRKYRNNYISLIISCICVEIFPLGTKWGQKYGKKNSKKRKSRLKNHIAD